MSTKATREAVTEDASAGRRYNAIGRSWTRDEAWAYVTEESAKIAEVVSAVFSGNDMQVRGALLAESERLGYKRALIEFANRLREYDDALKARNVPDKGRALLKPIAAWVAKERETRE